MVVRPNVNSGKLFRLAQTNTIFPNHPKYKKIPQTGGVCGKLKWISRTLGEQRFFPAEIIGENILRSMLAEKLTILSCIFITLIIIAFLGLFCNSNLSQNLYVNSGDFVQADSFEVWQEIFTGFSQKNLIYPLIFLKKGV